MESITNAIIWLLIIEIFSISIYPTLSIYFKGLSDRGFAVSKVLGIFIASYIVWLLSSLHISEFSRIEVAVVSFLTLISFMAVSFLHIKIKEDIISRLIEKKQLEHESTDVLMPEVIEEETKAIEHELTKEALIGSKRNFVSKLRQNKRLNDLIERFVKDEELTSRKELKEVSRLVVIEEIIFIVSFFVWVFIRGINPDIIGTEKFMDLGIMNAILKSSYFPPHDMWLSGYSLNYYYYGQYIYTFITQLSGISTAFTYNYSIATIFAFAFVLVFSIVHTLTKKYIPALISAFIMLLGGNINYAVEAIKYFIANHSLNGFSFWYPNSTRMIPYTINEYPIYSFIVSDLHAHVTNIPAVLTSIAITINIFNKRKFETIDFVLTGFILGIIAVTNSWDAIFYAAFIGIVILYIRLITKEDLHAISELSVKSKAKYFIEKIRAIEYTTLVEFFNLSIFEGVIIAVSSGVLGILMFSPFYMNFKAPVDGVGINIMAHSDPRIELLLFGLFFFFTVSFIGFLIYAFYSHKKVESTDFIAILFVITAIVLIITPEFFFLKDIFYKANPPYFRANTVFKLYYQAWILFSLLVGYSISRINTLFRLKDLKKATKPILAAWDVLAVLFLIASASYTYIALDEGYFNLSTNASCQLVCSNSFKTDDGTAYLKTLHPDDAAMINWLNQNAAPNSTIAEAVGDSYTYYARISVYTGLATVLGWPNHEYQWRNTYDYSGARVTDIFNLYNSGTSKDAKAVVKKYNIKYIIVGEQERLKYPAINEPVLRELGPVIFQSGSSYIIKTVS